MPSGKLVPAAEARMLTEGLMPKISAVSLSSMGCMRYPATAASTDSPRYRTRKNGRRGRTRVAHSELLWEARDSSMQR